MTIQRCCPPVSSLSLPLQPHKFGFSTSGENISDLESESESESEFLILGLSLPRTPISVPSLEPELSPSLSPSSTPESEPVSVPGPSRPSVLQESAPPTPTLVYQRRSKPDLLQKQIQSPEPEVSTENDSSSDDCAISDTCDTNPVDLPIALRKDKRSCPSLYRHPISQYVSTKHLSTQYQSFIAAVDSVKIPSSVEEALQNRNWVQAMDEEMRALEKNGQSFSERNIICILKMQTIVDPSSVEDETKCEETKVEALAPLKTKLRRSVDN
ncbi:hypothetical protein KIW84_034547 [Lathyrus oleraceus]|uniref:Mitochondrial protein n=1 Tax=Pisum sativum TaxID=3888 RepID=A0A9D5B4I5_PEA|nr:hypothetical protein KIW84_034547 [Pisum sativum]